jgi:hypothetical protein
MSKSLIPLLFCFAFVFIVLLLFVLLPLFNGFFPYSMASSRVQWLLPVFNGLFPYSMASSRIQWLLPVFNGFFPYSSIHNRVMVRVVVFNFQQYFSYIVAISFIGGGNRSTRRKPPTCTKSLTNIIT